MHMVGLWLVSGQWILLHTSQLQEDHGAPHVPSGPLMRSSPYFQVGAPDQIDNLILNTGQWQGEGDGLEVGHNAHGQNPDQDLQCSNGYLIFALCEEKIVRFSW